MRNTTRRSRGQALRQLVLLLLIVLLTHIATTEIWMIVNSTGSTVPMGCDSYALPWGLGSIPQVSYWADWYCNGGK